MTDLSYRMLQIAGVPAGLLGLEELYAALFEEGVTPEDAALDQHLLSGVKKHNFVPKPAEKDYLDVLRMEYVRYHRKRQSGKATVAREYGKWRGYPREQIPWFPTLSDALCTNCGACLETCAREVYELDENGKVYVAEPFLCMVGCCFCKSVCEPHALLFPTQDLLKNFREKM